MIDRKVSKYLSSDRKYYGFVSEKITGDKVEMTFEANYLQNGFPRWYLMFGDYAEIIEPEDLKLKVKELVVNLRNKLNS